MAMHKGTWVAVGVAGLAVIVALTAAQDRPAPSQDAAWHNRQQLALASLKAADGWKPLEGGLRWRRVEGNGSGRHPVVTDTVRIHYEGKLIDGTVFDSSWARNEPASFPLERLIKAWQLAVPMAGVGDTIEIAVPPELGYGPLGKGEIPGGAVMMFKIQLIAIE